MIEEGVYSGHLNEVQVGKSKNGSDGVFTSWLIEGEDTTRTVYTYITANTEKYAIKKLQAIGFNFDFADPQCSMISTNLRCTHDEYNGEPKERWDFSYGGGIEVSPLDKSDVAKLNAKYKQYRSTSAPASARPAPPVPAPAKKTVTREYVWDKFLDSKQCTDPENASMCAMEWSSLLSTVYPDVDESEFKSDHWAAVCLHMEVPF